MNCVGAASRTLDGYRQSYVEGQDSIGRWLSGGKVGSLLFTSSISVYPQSEGRSVDEKSSTEGHRREGDFFWRRKKNALLRQSASTGATSEVGGALRTGAHLMVEKLKAGQPFEGNANRTLNLIHVADAADAILHCLEAGPGSRGGIFNVSDGSHFSRKEIVSWLAGKLGVEATPFWKMTKAERPTARSP